MPSYLITGASGLLGFEFLRQLSQEPSNTVIGLVRDKAKTESMVSRQLGGRNNIHILQADITDYSALERAVAETAKLTDGRLDYLVANAASVSRWDRFDPIGVLALDQQTFDDEMLTVFRINVLGNVHLINLFMPLILKGQVRKVISISSGTADLEPMRQFDMELSSGYVISKAAMNAAVGKFSAQYRKDGVLFMSICPGIVEPEASHYADPSPEQSRVLEELFAKFKQYAPHFEEPARREDAVRDVISVWERASVQNGDGGSFVSHLGTKRWL